MQSALRITRRTTPLVTAIAATAAILSAQCGIDTNVGTAIPLADDAVSVRQDLGFRFPFAGATYDSLYISSNGFIYLFDTTGSLPVPTLNRCCTGTVTGLLGSVNPMIAGTWHDLNPNAGGMVHFNALPTKAMVTFMNVPEYGQPVTPGNSFQISLYPSGMIQMWFDTNCRNVTHVGLTGWSPGAGAADPGPSNLSSLPIPAASATVYELFPNNTFDLQGSGLQGIPTGPTGWLVVPISGCAGSSTYGAGCPTGATPLSLAAQAGSQPVIGTTFTMRMSNVRAGTSAGVLHLGSTNPNIDLGPIGMAGCRLLSSIDIGLGFAPVTPVSTFPLPIPNDPTLVGLSLNSQVAMVDLSLAGLPIYASNGLSILFGN